MLFLLTFKVFQSKMIDKNGNKPRYVYIFVKILGFIAYLRNSKILKISYFSLLKNFLSFRKKFSVFLKNFAQFPKNFCQKKSLEISKHWQKIIFSKVNPTKDVTWSANLKIFRIHKYLPHPWSYRNLQYHFGIRRANGDFLHQYKYGPVKIGPYGPKWTKI